MKLPFSLPLLAFVACVLSAPAATPNAPAATPPAEHPAHNELRAVRDAVTAAMNKADVEGILAHVHPAVTFTTMNGDVARGPQGIRDYFAKMMTGPDKIVTALRVEFISDSLSTLLQNETVGLAWGSTNDEYTLTGGKQLNIKARWSATMVKENGRWLVANVHYSTNMFDNPVLDALKKSVLFVGLGAGVVGLILGLVVGRKTSPARN